MKLILMPHMIADYCSIIISFLATVVAWRKVSHRGLFFMVSLLSLFGVWRVVEFISSVLQGLIWRREGFSMDNMNYYLQFQSEVCSYVYLLLMPILLRRLYLALRKRVG